MISNDNVGEPPTVEHRMDWLHYPEHDVYEVVLRVDGYFPIHIGNVYARQVADPAFALAIDWDGVRELYPGLWL